MTPHHKHLRAFSLIELLVAISILALVAAIIVPKYLNSHQQAVVATMNQNLSELNNAYSQWVSLGGTTTGWPTSNIGYGPAANAKLAASYMFGFLCEQGYNTPISTGVSGAGATPVVNSRDNTQGHAGYSTMGIADSYGPGGSWSISYNYNPGTIYTGDPENMFWMNPRTNDPSIGSLTQSSPDGFFVDWGSGAFYYKAGNTAYEVYFSPQNGFWVNQTTGNTALH